MVTLQPLLALLLLQFEFCSTVPACEPAVLIVHPAAVCSVMVSVPARLTPSITSISPEFGQFGPKSQNAGHTPQMEPGMCAMSAMKSPWV